METGSYIGEGYVTDERAAEMVKEAVQDAEERAYVLAAARLRAEVKRLDYPRSMFPQQAQNIARRQEAFEVAARYLEGN